MRFRHAIVISLIPASIAFADAESTNHGSIMIEPIGFAIYPIPSRGLELGLQVAGEDMISVSYASGTHSRLLTDYRVELALLRYRRQLTPMTHFNLGAGLRGLRQIYKVQRDDGSNASLRSESQLFVLESSFGNHFSVGPVNFGCDWLGVAVPIAPYRSTQSSPEGVDPSEQEENQDALQRVAWVPTLQLLRVSVGTTF